MIRTIKDLHILLILMALLLRVASQSMFKYLAITDCISLDCLAGHLLFYCSIGVMVLRAVCWQKALQYYSLSFAYAFMSLTFVSILVIGAVFFNESVTIGNIAGAVIIVFGVTLIASKEARH